MKALEIPHLFGELSVTDAFSSGEAARHRRVVGRLLSEARLTDRAGVVEFVLVFGNRHDDELDFLILDEVKNVGTPFVHAVDAAAGNARNLNHLRGAGSRNELRAPQSPPWACPNRER